MKFTRRVSSSIMLLFFLLLSCGMFAFVTGCGGGGGSTGGDIQAEEMVGASLRRPQSPPIGKQ
ncbi:MAG: hypothetical protein AB9903_33415 [Vulcanimicrobiota bacterium]